jgi:hypothetical protein|tara:strand:- start:651 stop:872 length:222 start_codon:yes stop_codon:yes gene_type:complete
MKRFHIIAMNCRINELMEEHQVTIIRLINNLAAHSFIYQQHAMRRIEKISIENPYVDDIPGFEKLTMNLEEDE